MRHGVTKTMRKALCKKERIERAFMLWIFHQGEKGLECEKNNIEKQLCEHGAAGNQYCNEFPDQKAAHTIYRCGMAWD